MAAKRIETTNTLPWHEGRRRIEAIIVAKVRLKVSALPELCRETIIEQSRLAEARAPESRRIIHADSELTSLAAAHTNGSLSASMEPLCERAPSQLAKVGLEIRGTTVWSVRQIGLTAEKFETLVEFLRQGCLEFPLFKFIKMQIDLDAL